MTLIQTGRPDYVYRGQETDTDYSEASKGLAYKRAPHRLRFADSDEINVALDYDLIRLNDVIELVKIKPESLEMVLTGRAAVMNRSLSLPTWVTEMKEVKHPYQKGIEARRGVEF